MQMHIFLTHNTPSPGLLASSTQMLRYYPSALIISVIWPLTDKTCWFAGENLDYNCVRKTHILYCDNFFWIVHFIVWTLVDSHTLSN